MSMNTWLGRKISAAGTVQAPPANNKAVSKFTNNYGFDITVTALVRLGSVQAGAKMKLLVYSDNAGAPNALLYTSSEFVGAYASPLVFTFGSPWTWANGVSLWLGMISDTTHLSSGFEAAGGNNVKYNADTYSDGPTDPFGTPSTANFEYRLFIRGHDEGDTIGFYNEKQTTVTQGIYYIKDPHFVKYTVSQTINVTDIFVHVTTTSASVQGRVAIYTPAGGGALYGSTLVAQSSLHTGTTANSWKQFTFDSPVQLTAGDYFFGLVFDERINCHLVDGEGTNLWAGSGDYADPDYMTFPATIPSSDPGTYPSDIGTRAYYVGLYATYTLPLDYSITGSGGIIMGGAATLVGNNVGATGQPILARRRAWRGWRNN